MTPPQYARVLVIGPYNASHTGPFTEILSLADVFQLHGGLNNRVSESNGVFGLLQSKYVVATARGVLLPYRNVMEVLPAVR